MQKNNVIKRLNRDSNVELLRLVCMLFIVVHHFVFYGPGIATYNADGLDSDSLIGAFAYSWVICAVDAFLLISGYYSIHFKAKGIVNLYVKCAWWGAVCYIAHILIDGGSIGPYYLSRNVFFSLSHTRWFISAYICLYFLSPILNSCIENISKKQFVYILASLSVLDFYFGWYWADNTSRYTVIHFVTIYFIGRYMASYLPPKSSHRRTYLFVYVLSSLLLFLIMYIQTKTGKIERLTVLLTQRNNSPLIVLQAIALFYFFQTIAIKSSFINKLAGSALAVYLIHQHPYVDKWINDYLSGSFYLWPNSARWFILLAFVLGVFVLCILLDQLSMYIYQPIANWLTKWIQKAFDYINKKYDD